MTDPQFELLHQLVISAAVVIAYALGFIGGLQ